MASLLESFFFLFESDADEVAKGADTAEAVVEDLENQIEKTDVAAEKLGDSFLDVTRAAGNAIAAIISIGAVTAASLNAAAQADEIGKFSRLLGLNIQELGAWNEAIIRSGGTAQSFQGSISALQRQLTDFALTGGGEAAEVFARLGVSAFNASGQVRSAFDILPELADVLSQLTEAEAVGFGEKLGLDQATILLLQQGRREVDALIRRQQQLGVVTEEDARIAEAFNDAWADMRQVFNRVALSLNASVLPVLTNVFSAINEFVLFLRDNQDLVTGFFIGVAGVIGTVYLPVILRAAAATLAVVSPFLLVGAAIAAASLAFALIYEDVVAFRRGNDSLIGLVVDRFPLITKAVTSVGDSFRFLKNVATEIFDAILNIPNDVEGSFQRITEAIIRLLKAWNGVVFDVVKNIAGHFVELLPRSVEDAVASMKQAFSTFTQFAENAFEALRDFILAALRGIGKALKDELPDFSGIAQSVRAFLNLDDEAETDLDTPQRRAPVDSRMLVPQVDEVSTRTETVTPIDRAMREGPLAESLTLGRTALQLADSNPLAGQTTTSIANNTNTANRTTHVSVGTVSVDARGGDADDIANRVGSALSDQLQQAVSSFDDGVVA